MRRVSIGGEMITVLIQKREGGKVLFSHTRVITEGFYRLTMRNDYLILDIEPPVNVELLWCDIIFLSPEKNPGMRKLISRHKITKLTPLLTQTILTFEQPDYLQEAIKCLTAS